MARVYGSVRTLTRRIERWLRNDREDHANGAGGRSSVPVRSRGQQPCTPTTADRTSVSPLTGRIGRRRGPALRRPRRRDRLTAADSDLPAHRHRPTETDE